MDAAGLRKRRKTILNTILLKEDLALDTALSRERNSVLDEVIAARRSVRAFTSEIPPRELIGQLLLAGLQAPYAALAVKEDVPYRFFRVICQGPGMIKAAGLIQEQAKANLELAACNAVRTH